jgi:WD40 repeat protein
LVVPRIEPKVAPRNPVNALASSPADGVLAVARYAEVELRTATNFNRLRTLAGHTGNVNALAFSTDGAQLFSAAGQPGIFGEVRQWNAGDGKLTRVIQGHKDAIYSLAIASDGAVLATGSYDQKIKLWNVASGQEIRTLSGHNGCVRDLAFRPDGKILASASADRTVKLWDVTTGERRETLSQPTKEVHSVAFSADGKRLFAGGADNRIRIWEISENAAETSNPLLVSKFAHEGSILKLAFSSDGKLLLSSGEDRTVRLWDVAELKERVLLERQPDWAPALAFVAGDTVAAVGRLDGSVGFYNVATGETALFGNETPTGQRVVRAGQPEPGLK